MIIVIISKRQFLEWRKEREEVDLGENKTNTSSEIEDIFAGHVSQDKHCYQGINYWSDSVQQEAVLYQAVQQHDFLEIRA